MMWVTATVQVTLAIVGFFGPTRWRRPACLLLAAVSITMVVVYWP